MDGLEILRPHEPDGYRREDCGAENVLPGESGGKNHRQEDRAEDDCGAVVALKHYKTYRDGGVNTERKDVQRVVEEFLGLEAVIRKGENEREL